MRESERKETASKREIKGESFPVTGRANKAVEAGGAVQWECLRLVSLLSKHYALYPRNARDFNHKAAFVVLYWWW